MDLVEVLWGLVGLLLLEVNATLITFVLMVGVVCSGFMEGLGNVWGRFEEGLGKSWEMVEASVFGGGDFEWCIGKGLWKELHRLSE